MNAVKALHSIDKAKKASELLPCTFEASVVASSSFRRIEHNMNDTNWPSVTLFTVCHLLFNFAITKYVAADNFDYLEVFKRVLRSTGDTQKQIVWHVRRAGLLEPSYVPARGDLDAAAAAALLTYNAETRTALELLALAKHPKGAPIVTVMACTQALESLTEWAIAADGYPRDWTQFFYWPCVVPPAFVLALEKKQPIATLIFIHWCAIMHRAPKAWFLDGWARRTAFAAMAEVPATNRDLLKWPMTVFVRS
jgi:hypothetical protein